MQVRCAIAVLPEILSLLQISRQAEIDELHTKHFKRGMGFSLVTSFDLPDQPVF